MQHEHSLRDGGPGNGPGSGDLPVQPPGGRNAFVKADVFDRISFLHCFWHMLAPIASFGPL